MTEATASAPCCGNCRYSVMETIEALVGRGACHRYAPRPNSGTWTDWPAIYSSSWCGEWESRAPADIDPPVSLQDVRALADFMAHTGATPLFDGFDGPSVTPSPEAPPATAEPEFLTYDQPFEDPLR